MGEANQRLSGNQIRLKLNQGPWVAMVSGTDRVYKLRLNFLDPDRTKDGVGEWMLDDGFYCYSESRGGKKRYIRIADGDIEEVDQAEVIQVMEEQEGFLAYW